MKKNSQNLARPLRLLGGLALWGVGSQSALAFEPCLPPQCAAPMAADFPAAFGSSPLQLACMALSLLCAWLIVWGIFHSLGFQPRRRAPIILAANPEAKADWERQQDLAQQAWKEAMSDPQKRSAIRLGGFKMLCAGSALAWIACSVGSPLGPDLSGSSAHLLSWNAQSSQFDQSALIRLLPEGKACKQQADLSCPSWGAWTNRDGALTLVPAQNSESILRFWPDDSMTRYWERPGPDKALKSAAFLDLPKQAQESKSEKPFTAKSAERGQ